MAEPADIPGLDLAGMAGSILKGLGAGLSGGPSSAFQDVMQNPIVGGEFLTSFGSGSVSGTREIGGKGGAVAPGGTGSGMGGAGISNQTLLIGAGLLLVAIIIKGRRK